MPAVSVHETEGEAVVDVPLDVPRAGARQQLSRALRLRRYPLCVTAVELVPADQGTVVVQGRPSLVLHPQLGDVIDGRLLLYPSLVTADGQALGWNIRWRPGNASKAAEGGGEEPNKFEASR